LNDALSADHFLSTLWLPAFPPGDVTIEHIADLLEAICHNRD
jgi:hypothetical protein